jgi:hypothetical protein
MERKCERYNCSEWVRVAIVSFFVTWLFFIEYIPPTKKVHLWSDIEGYHYPLLSYTHKSLRDGRIPLWDPAIYSGISFVGNIQAALFYPPNWLLFLANAYRNGLLYTTVEILTFGHVWLAFVLAYLWLRARSKHWMPAVMGAGVAACCGYVLSQLNHLGVSNAYAWMPLGLWGIDEASRTGSWRPLWKLAVASAMCLLAGYPATVVAFSIVAIVYAVTLRSRVRLVPQTLCALAFALLLGAVQLLPALEATQLKVPERMYGGPMPDKPYIYLSFLLPNYYNQNRVSRGPDFVEADYFYLGAPALFAFLYLLRRPRLQGAATALGVAGVCYLIIENPQAKLEQIVNSLPVLPDVLRSYNLLIGFALPGALLAAAAVDDFLARPAKRAPGKRWQFVWMTAALLWSVYLVCLWPRGTPDFMTGVRSALYPLVLLVLMGIGLALYRSSGSRAVATVLLISLFIDYKAFGTNRRFSAISGNGDEYFRGDARVGGPSLRGLHDQVYQYLLKHPTYRIALVEGPHATDFRFYRLTTPQGFDPFLSQQYKDKVETFLKFSSNRLFDVDPRDEQFLKQFGVGFVMIRESNEMAAALRAHPRFRLLQPSETFFQVYQYLDAQPAWRFGEPAEVMRWTPERREFRVNATANHQFMLIEQFWPGWKAYADGRRLTIERCQGTFQCATVPAGTRNVQFLYRPASFYLGAVLSLAAWLSLCVLNFRVIRKNLISSRFV